MYKKYEIISIAKIPNVNDEYLMIKLKRPNNFPIKPGQFIVVVSPLGQRLFFAVSNYITSNNVIDIIVKLNEYTNFLLSLSTGALLEIEEPSGCGYPSPLKNGYVLLAAGSGITSLVPLYEAAIVYGIPAKLVYVDRSYKMLFKDLFKVVSSEESPIIMHDTTIKGRPTSVLSLLGDNIDIAETRICACGPKKFIEAIKSEVVLRGHDASLVNTNWE